MRSRWRAGRQWVGRLSVGVVRWTVRMNWRHPPKNVLSARRWYCIPRMTGCIFLNMIHLRRYWSAMERCCHILSICIIRMRKSWWIRLRLYGLTRRQPARNSLITGRKFFNHLRLMFFGYGLKAAGWRECFMCCLSGRSSLCVTLTKCIWSVCCWVRMIVTCCRSGLSLSVVWWMRMGCCLPLHASLW